MKKITIFKLMRTTVFLVSMTNIINFSVAQITPIIGDDKIIYPLDGNGNNNVQAEVHICIDQANPQNIIASANTYVNSQFQQGYYYTNDGGVSWNGSDEFPNCDASCVGVGLADPSVAIDANGNIFISTIMPYRQGYLIRKSLDHGQTWLLTPSVGISSFPFDKEMIVADISPNSPYLNQLYCAWNGVGFNYSADGGNNFSLKNDISSIGVGPNIQTGPNGEVYICWAENFINGQPSSCNMGFAKDLTDGGTNFTTTIAFPYTGIIIQDETEKNWNYGGINLNNFPSMAVDKSCGPYRGRIYIVYPDHPDQTDNPNANPGDGVIKIRYSDDQGDSWSAAKTISIPVVGIGCSGFSENFFPWIAVDNSTGIISVVYYNIFDAAGCNIYSTNLRMAYSSDGGNTFNDLQLNYNTIFAGEIPIGFRGGYMGDYIGVAAYGGKAYAAWMSTADGSTQTSSGQWKIHVRDVTFQNATNYSPSIYATPLICDGSIKVNSCGLISPLTFAVYNSSAVLITSFTSSDNYTKTITGLTLDNYTISVTDNNATTVTTTANLNFDIDGGITISGNPIWNTNKKIRGTITVPDGQTLTIQGTFAQPTTIEFAQYSGIYIMNGGKVVLEYATLTNISGCDEIWNGIAMDSYSPYGISGLKMSYSTIKNSLEGVHSITSINSVITTPIIDADNSSFINNQHPVSITVLGGDIGDVTNLGYQFKTCTFEFNSSSPSQIVTPVTFISLDNNSYPVFLDGNTFNSNAPTLPANQKPIGIQTTNGNLLVVQGNKFNDLQSGIISYGAGSESSVTIEGNTYNNPLTIQNNNTFNNIPKGIYIQGTWGANIKGNTFNTPAADILANNNYGIYMVGADGFEISGNTISGTASNGGALFATTYGIVAENTSSNLGVIFNNDFSGMDYHVQTQYDNSQLKIRCNNFDRSTSVGPSLITFNNLRQQGKECALAGADYEHLAGNEWTQCPTSTGLYDDIYTFDQAFIYNAHEKDIAGNDFVTNPQNCTNLQLIENVELWVCPGVQMKMESCTSSIPGLKPPPDGDCNTYLRSAMQLINSYETEINGAKAQLKRFDGGNTTALIRAINQNPPLSAITLMKTMLATFPHTEQTLIALLNRKYPTPPSTIDSIMVINSPLSPEVMENLREHPLPPPNMKRVEAAQKKPAFLRVSDLQGLIAYDEGEIQQLENLQNQTVPCETKEQVRERLHQSPTIESKKLLAQMLLAENKFSDAKAMLNTVSLMTDTIWWKDTTAKVRMKRENDNFCKMMNCLVNVAESGRSIRQANASEIQTLREVASEKNNIAAKAEVLITMLTGENFEHPIKKITEHSAAKKTSEQLPIDNNTLSFTKVYPNPANNVIMIESNEGEIVFYDMLGRILKRIKLNESNTQISTSDWQSGLYFYELKIQDRIDRGKLIIAK